MTPIPRAGFTRSQVNVGYYPKIVTVNCEMYAGPGERFPLERLVSKGAHFAVQSKRNPDRLPDPGKVEPVERVWLWGYTPDSQSSEGWINDLLLTADLSGRDWAHGPAGLDFQIGRGLPTRKRTPRWRIGHRMKGELAFVKARGPLYIRYAERGAAFGYLLHGDRVRQWWRGRQFTWIEVLESEVFSRGTCGFVLTRELAK